MNIFEAIDEKSNYLKPNGTADQQILKPRLITVGTSEVQLLNQYMKTGGALSPFILEGKSAGKGDLTLIVKVGGVVMGRNSIELELKEISDFWEKHVVKTTTTSGDEVQTTSTQVGIPTYTPTPDTDEYVLFVHGWNMGGWETNGWEKDRWAETVFKRLWWLGYKGRVGGFQWPTLGMTSYDQSELRAWNSAQALTDLITRLNANHRAVRVIAHSMGNVVMGEALWRMPTMTPPRAPMVHSYIAAQAAISAHLYDNNVHPYWPDGYTTPNILGYYTTGKAPSLPYLVENKTRVRTGSLFNYFNKNDFALGVWKTNNRLKPDEFHFGYSYHDEDKDPDTYAPLLGDFFIQQFNGQTRYLDIYSDRLEIFARCAQSRSQTLGSETSAVDGFSPLDLEASFGYGDKHYYHSMEFRSNIINQRPFWSRVGKDFLLEGFNDLH